jgi:hypothetical protein
MSVGFIKRKFVKMHGHMNVKKKDLLFLISYVHKLRCVCVCVLCVWSIPYYIQSYGSKTSYDLPSLIILRTPKLHAVPHSLNLGSRCEGVIKWMSRTL